ncbi:MAG: hypothetical protein GXY85_02725 [Candidatus Brocadiaceae bacterium]|nr:hypothetical protein [Candidatus Brocadiaceae bacterium]
MAAWRSAARGAGLAVVAISALVCVAAGGRAERGAHQRPDPGPPIVIPPQAGLHPGGGPQHDRGDLLTLLAGPVGAAVFGPGASGIFDPGGWGLFETPGPHPAGGPGTHGGAGAGPSHIPGTAGAAGVPLPPGLRPGGPNAKEPDKLDISDVQAWGIVPLLAAGEAALSAKADGGVMSVEIKGKNRRAVETIQRLIPAGRPGGAREPREPHLIEAQRDGVVLRMDVPHPGSDRMKEAVKLQVKAVENLSEAMAAAREMRGILRSGRLRTHWERHEKGAALVFEGPKELRKAAETVESFFKFLENRGDDLAAARRETAPYFRPGPHGWGQGPGGPGGPHGR